MDIGRFQYAQWHMTGVLCNILPLLARDSALTHSNKVTLYKSLIRSILTYDAPVWSSTWYSNYLRRQVIQSNCLRVIGNQPRRTPTSHLNNFLNTEPIRCHPPTYCQIFRLLLLTPQTLVQQIGNYTLADLTALYRKYKHKRTKHILL
jgi:hypothetical protein